MENLTKENTANSKIIDDAVYVLKTECKDEISQSSFEKISKILGFKLPFKNGKEFKSFKSSGGTKPASIGGCIGNQPAIGKSLWKP